MTRSERITAISPSAQPARTAPGLLKWERRSAQPCSISRAADARGQAHEHQRSSAGDRSARAPGRASTVRLGPPRRRRDEARSPLRGVLLDPGVARAPTRRIDLCVVFCQRRGQSWHVAEPGRYEIFATLGGHEATAISRPLLLRVAHPRHREEERLAQEYFTDEVGRALALGAP